MCMKKFFLKIGFAIVFFSILIWGVYYVLHCMSKKYNELSNGNDNVFVWGDSQMFQGLDVSLLEKIIGKQILTSAEHGAGIYDFLVCEKNIPNNSVCIVSFPECALLRNPLSDNNRTGFEWSCILELFKSGCPLDECQSIVGLNQKSIFYKVFRKGHSLYPYSDTLVYPEPLPLWRSLFEDEKDWFSWKANSYKKGIQYLVDKRSQIILVQFPFDKQIESFACNSVNRHLTDSLKNVIIKDYALDYEKIVLNGDSLLMHDLSHMNEVGARLLTAEVASVLQIDTVNNHFIEVIIR